MALNFQDPLFLILILPLVGLWWWVFRNQKRPRLKVSSLVLSSRGLSPKDNFSGSAGSGEGASGSKTWKTRWASLPDFLYLLTALLTVVALARPQMANQQIKRNVQGVDIMIVLDISDSMLIEDMKPMNRLEAAKNTIAEFVKNRSTDRLGVLVFAGESFTLVPLTLDYELLLARVSEITTARQARIRDGTALGVALANGSARLKDSTAKSRIMIFLTDGENNTGTIDPETGLSVAKGYGIKIYSIGIGRDGPTRIPLYTKDVFGRDVKTYQPFESRVNDDLLSRMASETGGKYFRATQENSLGTVFSEIDRLEKTDIEINKYTKFDEKYEVWLFYAIVLAFLAFILQETLLRRLP